MSKLKKIRIAAIVLAFGFWLLPFAFKASAHEPITTKVRFNKEVVRIFERSCLSCHRPGGIAFFSLATYEEARPWAKAIKEEMLEKRMPVWHAVKGFGDFRNAPRLTQREMDLIVNWVEGGAPKGEDKDYPATPVYSDDWALGKPDVILQLAREQKVASGADEVRAFILPTNFKEDRWINAIDLRPSNGAVVLSASIYLENQKSGVRSQESGVRNRKSDSAMTRKIAGQSLYDSGQRTADSGLLLSTWVPGQKMVRLPEDVGRLIPAGARITLKIHYRGNGEEAKDRSAVGLYLAKTPVRKPLRDVAITNPEAMIPANQQAHPLKTSFTLLEDSQAIAIRPFTSPLIISFQASAFLPDGTEQVLIWSRGNKYDWQPTYYFNQPVAFVKGTRLEVTAYFDNSDDNANNPNDPPKPLRWSEITSEPLCSLLVTRASATIAKLSTR